MKRDLIFIAHRIPYPADRGEKIRALNVVQHLSADFRIHLGCLMPDESDPPHLDALREWCTEVAGFRIDRRRQRWSALARIRPGRPLMLDYYRHPGLQAWVNQVMARTPMDIVYIYSAAMFPYVERLRRPGMILDAVDIDSEKWTAYAAGAGFPMKLVWSREGRTLLDYERRAAAACDATLFVSQQECDRFAALSPETVSRVHAVENGVDLARFSPDHSFERPYDDAGPHIVFTGNMDYWPNADAAAWFAHAVLPGLRARRPGLRFYIVGADPGADLLRLDGKEGVRVTGRVADVRPYVAYADVSVAPLRIARGIQNKVLEAMALGRPVVASPQAFEGVRAVPGRDLLVGDGAEAFARAVGEVLDSSHPGLGAAGRAAMQNGYSWSATLARLDSILAAASDAEEKRA